MKIRSGNFALICFLALLNTSIVAANTALPIHSNFPLICNLNIGAPSLYDKPDVINQLAKADITLLGFYRTWELDQKRLPGAMRATVQKIKAKNPNVLIGQYTVLNEAPDGTQLSPDQDKADKINAMDWWVRGVFGQKLQWTKKYGKYDVNITMFSQPDEKGFRYPEWLAERDYNTFFAKVPEFDIWYLDNVLGQPKISLANWTNNENNSMQSAASIQTAYRAGHVAEWQAIRQLKPEILLVGNVDYFSYATPEYSNQLNGIVLEAMMGLKWSTEKLKGWPVMMQRYHGAFEHLRSPKLVIFNVHGKINDYQLMRFGLTSALMNNGYFSYSELNGNYRSIPWFDEFDIDLGQPLDGPQTAPWQNGVYRREFTNGLVLVNPTQSSRTVTVGPGFMRIKGKQAPAVNNGKSVGTVTLGSRDGLVLVRQHPR